MPARSRGIDTIDTVRPTGSRDTTISESVSASVRPGPESTPISRTFNRSLSWGSAAETALTFESAKIWANIDWAAVPAFQTNRWGATVKTRRAPRPTAPSRPGRPGIAPVGEGVEGGDAPPDQDDDVHDEEGAEDRRRDQPGEHHRRPIAVPDQPHAEQDDQRRDAEQEGRPEASVDRLAGAGQDRREGRRDQAPDVGRSAVRPDPPGLAEVGRTAGAGRAGRVRLPRRSVGHRARV